MQRACSFVAAVAMSSSGWCAAQQPCGQWLDLTHEIPGVGGQVYQMTMWDRDGAGPEQPWLVVVGSFELAGDEDATQVAAWDGTRWRGLAKSDPRSTNRCVYAVGTYQNQLIIGGLIDTWDNQFAMNVVSYDGTKWTPLLDGPRGAVRSIREFNGKLVVGGEFTEIHDFWNRAPALHVASWDGTSWSAMGSSVVGWVTQMVDFQGVLYAGGSSLSRWNGSAWESIGAGFNTIYALTLHGGELIVGGRLAAAMAGSDPSPNLIRFDGTSWRPLGCAKPVVSAGSLGGALLFNDNDKGMWQWKDGVVSAVTPGREGSALSFQTIGDSLYMGGLFTTVNGVGVLNVARYDGVGWHTLGRGFNAGIGSMTTWNGKLVVGGDFTHAGDFSVGHVAVLDNGVWKPLGAGIPGQSGPYVSDVEAIGSTLYVGGSFPKAGTVASPNVGRWNGTSWQALGPGLGTAVQAGAVVNSSYYAGSNIAFQGSAGVVYRWTGSNWLQAGSTFSGPLNDVYNFKGQLIAGGSFSSNGTRSMRNVARWDGFFWQPLGSGVSYDTFSGSVYTIGEYKGELYVGGWLNTAGPNTFARHLARFDGKDWLGIATLPYWPEAIFDLAEYRKQLFAATDGGLYATDLLNWRRFADVEASAPLYVFNDELYLDPGIRKIGGKWRPFLARWRACAVCDGDLNGDRVVDDLDFQEFATAYDVMVCWEPGMAPGCVCDFNLDRVVNDQDFTIFVQRYNELICPE